MSLGLDLGIHFDYYCDYGALFHWKNELCYRIGLIQKFEEWFCQVEQCIPIRHMSIMQSK